MKISALVTSLVLGISSVAAAAPSAPAVQSNAQFVAAARFAPPMDKPGTLHWMLLDTAKPSRFGRQVIAVDTKVRFTKLKLQATRGSALIDKVMITFANGQKQVVELDKRLGGHGNAGVAVIDLDGRGGRQIAKIVILSKSSTRGSYAVLAG